MDIITNQTLISIVIPINLYQAYKQYNKNKIMNTAELKSDLHRLIVETNDINILANIKAILPAVTNQRC